MSIPASSPHSSSARPRSRSSRRASHTSSSGSRSALPHDSHRRAAGGDRRGSLVPRRRARLLGAALPHRRHRGPAHVLRGLVRGRGHRPIEPLGWKAWSRSVSLRSIAVRSLSGEVIRVHNSEVKAVRVVPRGFREFEAELYVSDLEAGRGLVERVARIVPSGPGHFVRRPIVDETEELDDDLFRIRRADGRRSRARVARAGVSARPDARAGRRGAHPPRAGR